MLSVYIKNNRRYFIARIIEEHEGVISSKFAICYDHNADELATKCTTKMIDKYFGDLKTAQEKLDDTADCHKWVWAGENETMPQYRIMYKSSKTIFALEEV